jgi:hypothetical protein
LVASSGGSGGSKLATKVPPTSDSKRGNPESPITDHSVIALK